MRRPCLNWLRVTQNVKVLQNVASPALVLDLREGNERTPRLVCRHFLRRSKLLLSHLVTEVLFLCFSTTSVMTSSSLRHKEAIEIEANNGRAQAELSNAVVTAEQTCDWLVVLVGFARMTFKESTACCGISPKTGARDAVDSESNE